MKNYLTKIENNEFLNYKAFIDKCFKSKISRDELKNIFSVTASDKKNQYFLNIKNQELYQEVFGRFFVKSKDKKVQAAIAGNSKTVKSDYCLLNIKLNFDDPIAKSMLFNKTEYFIDFKIKKKLIIIENLNNFYDIKSSFDGEDINIDDYNFVWGAGNMISNDYYKEFLNNYDEIICFFDIDLGGLKFFKSLLKHIKVKINFFFSLKMKEQIKKHGVKIEDKDIFSLNKYSNITELKEVVQFSLEHKKFAEQEIFQYNNEVNNG